MNGFMIIWRNIHVHMHMHTHLEFASLWRCMFIGRFNMHMKMKVNMNMDMNIHIEIRQCKHILRSRVHYCPNSQSCYDLNMMTVVIVMIDHDSYYS